MQKQFLLLPLLLTVSCVNAMERENSENNNDSVFARVAQGMQIDSAELPQFYKDFERDLANGTINPNAEKQTGVGKGFPVSDALLEACVFNTFSVGKPTGLYFENDDYVLPFELYKKIAREMDHNAKHNYTMDNSGPGFAFSQCIKKEKEGKCDTHCDIIDSTSKNPGRYAFSFKEPVSHETVLEIISCALSSEGGFDRKGFNEEERAKYKKRLDRVKEIYGKSRGDLDNNN